MFEGFVADRKPLRLASFPRRFHACSQRGLLGRWKGAEVDSLTRCYSRKEAHTGGDFIGKRKSVAAWLLLDVGINCAVDELKLSSNEEHFLFSNRIFFAISVNYEDGERRVYGRISILIRLLRFYLLSRRKFEEIRRMDGSRFNYEIRGLGMRRKNFEKHDRARPRR